MLTLTKRELDALMAQLRRIRSEAGKPDRRRYAIENLVDKAVLIINKAKRNTTQSHDSRIPKTD